MAEGAVSSCHASFCSGKYQQCSVGSVGVCPMWSRKVNGLDKGSSNNTAVIVTDLIQEKDFVFFGDFFGAAALPVK